MAQFLTPALLQVSDASANPLVGAKEFIYQTNTTTLLSLFSNEGLSTPIANPMIADAAGVFPICFIAETKFKVVLKSAADVVLYTLDPVYSTGQADNILAENVSFDGSGIGFSSTNVQDAIVELYGSVAHLSGADFTGTLSTTGDFSLKGTDSAANVTTYAGISKTVIDNTDASEDGELSVKTMVAGTYAARLNMAQGIWTTNATGGDKGIDTLNAAEYYRNGARLNSLADVILEERQASATDAGTFTSGAWQTRVLNVEAADPSNLCTLAAGAFTFTVGGRVKWRAPAIKCDGHQTRLYNVTDSAVVKSGSTAYSDSADRIQTDSVGWATVVAAKQYRIEHQCTTTRATEGFGKAAGFGELEVYTQLEFWRTA